MKRVIVLLLAFVVPFVVVAEEQKTDLLQQPENSNVFKGLMYKVWNKFRTMTPRDNTRQVKNTVVTAGIRGAESTSSLLTPYWKGDQTKDAEFIKQLSDFTRAQEMVDRGQLPEASAAFEGFISNWPASELKPNAQFALAMALGGMGDRQKSVSGFEAFVAANPGHPLVEDAKAMIGELK